MAAPAASRSLGVVANKRYGYGYLFCCGRALKREFPATLLSFHQILAIQLEGQDQDQVGPLHVAINRIQDPYGRIFWA